MPNAGKIKGGIIWAKGSVPRSMLCFALNRPESIELSFSLNENRFPFSVDMLEDILRVHEQITKLYFCASPITGTSLKENYIMPILLQAAARRDELLISAPIAQPASAWAEGRRLQPRLKAAPPSPPARASSLSFYARISSTSSSKSFFSCASQLAPTSPPAPSPQEWRGGKTPPAAPIAGAASPPRCVC
jgi:hypothetical protein